MLLISVLDYVERAAKRYPNKAAFIETDKTITFGDFYIQIKKRASYLHHNGYFRKEQARPVVIMQKKGIDALLNFFAVAWTGNIYVPFDVGTPQERLKKMLDVLQPALIISEPEFAGKVEGENAGISVLRTDVLTEEKEVDENCLLNMRRKIIDTDPLYIICTSGSTGTPKGVVVSHRAVIDFTEEASEVMQFSADERFISQVPFYFDVSVLDIYCTLRNASQLHIVPKEYFVFPAQVMQYIQEKQINALIWVPSALVLAANLKLLDEIDVTCLKKIMFCGEVMPNKQLNIWRKAVPGAKYVNYYGPAETTCASTYYIVDREFNDDEPLPIGFPAYNTGIMILDENDKYVEDGDVGELCIEGSGVSLGYYNNYEKTKDNFIQNPNNPLYEERIYKTGDLVKINEYGELMFVGRKDCQIKHMGYRIELGEIETAANSIEEIEMGCCLYDEEKKQIVLVYAGKEQDERILNGLKDKIPQYMLPQRLIHINQMPLNANGKINRKMLKEQIQLS